MQRRLTLGLLALLVFAGPATAQALDDPEAGVVEELVITARLPGPAWWRVSDTDTTIYVMGIPSALPTGMSWDRSVLERRLKGAFVMLTPPEGQSGLKDIPATLSLMGKLRTRTPLDRLIPAALQKRLAAVRVKLKKSPKAYDDWKPLAAGLQIMIDFTKLQRIRDQEPPETIKRIARRAGVKTRPTGVYPAMPVARQVVNSRAEAAGLICLEEAINAVEGGAGPIQQAAVAWAEGDVRGALGDPRGFERCALGLPGIPDLRRRAIKEEADALQAALKTPGHAVAILSVRSLVAEGGILEQLRARGVQVTTPD